MVEFIKRKRMEKYIQFFIYNFCKEYPFYLHNLNKNIELSKLLIELYRNLNIDECFNYQSKFDVLSTIELASEILESISPALKDKYLDEIKKGRIEYKEAPYSFLECNDGKYNIVINTEYDNITMAIASVHEFFHLLHLEQVQFNGDNENYYCYTEALGMSGEIYSLMYLYENRKEYLHDVLAYISELAFRLNNKANETLVDGVLISIYDEYDNLSIKSIKKYVKSFDIPKDYEKILSYKDYAHLDYYDDVRYIYSLPQALVIAYRLFNEYDFKNDFCEILSELSEVRYVKWADRHFNSYIESEDKLLELYNELIEIINNLFKSKVKKIGEI